MKIFWALLLTLSFRVLAAEAAPVIHSRDTPPLQGRVRVIRTRTSRRNLRPYKRVEIITADAPL